jgi:hypothetical protein
MRSVCPCFTHGNIRAAKNRSHCRLMLAGLDCVPPKLERTVLLRHRFTKAPASKIARSHSSKLKSEKRSVPLQRWSSVSPMNTVHSRLYGIRTPLPPRFIFSILPAAAPSQSSANPEGTWVRLMIALLFLAPLHPCPPLRYYGDSSRNYAVPASAPRRRQSSVRTPSASPLAQERHSPYDG